MWIMTENDVLLNTDHVEQVYWVKDGIDDYTGAGNWSLIARTGGKEIVILSSADVHWEERESMMDRLWLEFARGGLFKATDLYKRR